MDVQGSRRLQEPPAAPEVVEHHGLLVVRDDRLEGGTKARVLPILFDAHEEYVYAGPVYGYAQVALAHCAAAAGKRATIFCAARKSPHARTLEAFRAGARIAQVPHGYLTVVQARAREYCQLTGAKLLPFGLDTPEIVDALADIARGLPVRPKEVWSVAGSGTLTRALQRAWPRAEVYAVRVGAEPHAGRAKLFVAKERFEDDAMEPPPFPSCSNYDAKAWRFLRRHASAGALFWNVAA